MSDDSFTVNSDDILKILPVAVAVVDTKQKIVWCNPMLGKFCDSDPIGQQFYRSFGNPDITGPDFNPFHTNRRLSKTTFTTFTQRDKGRTFQMISSPIPEPDGVVKYCLVLVRDVTEQSKAGLKFDLLRGAGKELADLSEQDLQSLTPTARVELLSARIIKYAKEILHFDTIEIRLLSDEEPFLLKSLLDYGMSEEAKKRKLYAFQDGNGITGWVAYHGKPYLMDEPTEDPFYLNGIAGAKSSMTVPLLYHGQVIGTFNVESSKPKAFTENDMMFLQFYANDVATAVHTLDLLTLEQRDAAFRSVSTIFSDVMRPLNNILVETAILLSNNRGADLDLAEHLHLVQDHVQDVREIIRRVGETVAPKTTAESEVDCRNYPQLRNKKILVVSNDDSIGEQICKMLFYYGCFVDSAENGTEAIKMIESKRYDVIFSDIKLPDMSAFACFERAREVLGTPYTPYVFMTVLGSYDGEHVATKAAEFGSNDRLGKPFSLKLLLRILMIVLQKASTRNPPTM